MLGKVIDGKYRIDRALTPGTDVDRYAGVHLATTRDIEILMLRDPDNEDAKTALFTQVQMLGSFSHPALQRVLDSGIEGGAMYVVREAVKGELLGAYIERHKGQVPHDVCASVLLDVAEVLKAAHKRGYVFRLIEPRDVVVVSRGGEFGGKLVGARFVESTSMRSSVRVPGTSPYLAPEVRRREPASPAADLYSLGKILQTMVTGKPGGLVQSDTAKRAIERATAENVDERCPEAEVFMQAVGLLAPYQGQPARDQINLPEDLLDADLHYLTLRRKNRYGTRATKLQSVSITLRNARILVEALYKTMGGELWANLVRDFPDTEQLLPGASNEAVFLQNGVPIDLVQQVLQVADAHAGAMFTLVRRTGEMIATRGLNRVYPEMPATVSPEVLVEGFAHLWVNFAGQGTVQKIDRDGDVARFAVSGQLQPSLEITGLFVGMVRGALRQHGAPRAQIRVLTSQSLGDKADLISISLRGI